MYLAEISQSMSELSCYYLHYYTFPCVAGIIHTITHFHVLRVLFTLLHISMCCEYYSHCYTFPCVASIIHTITHFHVLRVLFTLLYISMCCGTPIYIPATAVGP